MRQDTGGLMMRRASGSGFRDYTSSAAGQGGRMVQSARDLRQDLTGSARGEGSRASLLSARSSRLSGDQQATLRPRQPQQMSTPQSPAFSRTAPGDQMMYVGMGSRQGSFESVGSARSSQAGSYYFPRQNSYGSEASFRSDEPASEASTPCAGAIGYAIRTFGNGTGRLKYEPIDHFTSLGVADNEEPGSHGRERAGDMQDGMDRCIGHGRRFLGGHWASTKGPRVIEADDIGNHGHHKGPCFQGGIPRYVGYGRRKAAHAHKDHVHRSAAESDPGLHGHPRGDDFKDGLQYYVGNGKRRLRDSHDGRSFLQSPGMAKAAGLDSRQLAMIRHYRDPTRRGTHKDRREGPKVNTMQEDHVTFG